MTAILVICCILLLLTAAGLLVYGVYAVLSLSWKYLTRLPDKFRGIIVYHESHDITEYGIIVAIANGLHATLRNKCECDIDDWDYKSYCFSVSGEFLLIGHNPPQRKGDGIHSFCLDSFITKFHLADPEIIEKIKEWHEHRAFCYKHGISEKK